MHVAVTIIVEQVNTIAIHRAAKDKSIIKIEARSAIMDMGKIIARGKNGDMDIKRSSVFEISYE